MMEKLQQSSIMTDEDYEVESTVKTQNDCSSRKRKAKRICSKSFRRIDNLKNHQLSHNRKINPYVCYNCKKKFIRQTNLAKHKCSLAKKRFGQQSIQKNVVVLPENTGKSTKIVDNEPFNCMNERETSVNVVCPNETLDNMGAQNKIAFSFDNELIQGRREVTSKVESELPRNSNICSKNCTLTEKSLDIVEQNEITSEEVYVRNSIDCEITSACPEAKLADNKLNENVPPEMVLTDNPRNAVCNACPKDFCTNSSLKQRVHTQPSEKQHANHSCGKAPSQNCGFGNQIDQNITPTSNVYECEVCHEEFSKTSFLKTHFLAHSAEELEQVKKFLHLLPKNPSSVNKFKCDVCNKAFRDSCDIKRHLLKHTGSLKIVQNFEPISPTF
ncbi:hypothetical protein JTE90_018034 [Oedothorax gibbosus]|uniref:C2H2-type domain-containing protein n=1 Tax=Oedothorax gibbosus TaxID=931172 RepID=A0AAV6V7E3_9ARAC|nr:hypothetical protein JTE90_018034 [Oedothorax gibbosus]